MVASSGSGSRDGGGGGGSRPQAVKKGPWTTAEDAILLEYVRRHGEGNWNAVQRNSGLLRCGKSCRLRWANHLRPNLKKGSFSPEEERLIIELHAKLGNKWARMASQLPGRTDNEIKNYWNTRIKRLQRSGLPIYPDDIPQHNQQSRLQQQQHNTYPKSKFSPSFSLLQPIDFPTNPIQPSYNSSFLPNPNHQFKLFRDNARSSSNFSLPLAPSIFPLIPNQGYQSDFWPAYSLDQFGSVSTAETELPSIQSPVVAAAAPSSSGTSSAGDYMIGTNSNPPDPTANSGLLEDLVEESKSLVHAQNSKGELFEAGDEETCVFGAGLRVEDGGEGMYDSSSPYSSVGMKEKDPIEEMNAIDDDLSSLLNNFPLTVPLPNWYDASANTSSNGKSSNMEENGNARVENSPEESHSPGATALATTSHKWSLSSRCWNNLPGIC